MKVLVVSVNGRHVCDAGIGPEGSVGVTLHWGRDGEPYFGVGGLDCIADEHLRWDAPELQAGDEITIRLVDKPGCDPPSERKTPKQLKEDEQAFMEELRENHIARQSGQ
jgi:hypothetical protein